MHSCTIRILQILGCYFLTIAALPAAAIVHSSQDAPASDLADAEVIATANRIEKEVERVRGLQFKHSVKKGVYDKERLAALLDKEAEKEKLHEQYAWQEKAMKVMGLLPESMDLLKETKELLLEQIGGFYDPDAKELRVMHGVAGTIGDIVMAHELCHALEDQHYDLKDIDESNKKASPDDDDRAFASGAVFEGSATQFMNQFFMHQAQNNKMSMEELTSSMDMGNPMFGGDKVMKLPPILVRPLLERYLGGQQFLCRGGGMFSQADPEDIERAFLEPPLSSEQVLHPDKYWSAAKLDRPQTLRIPDISKDLGEGWRRLGQNVMGELGVVIVTTEPEPPPDGGAKPDPMSEALKMMNRKKSTKQSRGWDGDRYQYYEGPGGTGCLLWVSVWDTEKDAGEFAQWITQQWKTNETRALVRCQQKPDNMVIVSAVRMPAGEAVVAAFAERFGGVADAIITKIERTEARPLARKVKSGAAGGETGGGAESKPRK